MLKKSRNKRWIVIVTVMMMILTLVPATAFADTTPEYAFIPNSGEASVSKVDLVNMTEVARYYTEPRVNATADRAWRTSRIAQDVNGNAFVLNTGADSTGLQGSVARIQADTKGLTNTCTSAAEVLPFGTDQAVQVMNVGASGEIPRAIAIDKDGYIWIGFYSGGYLQKYSYNAAGPSMVPVGPQYKWSTDLKFYEIKFAPDGKLWISSRDSTPTVDGTAGIFSFDPSAESPVFTPEQTFVPYSLLFADDGTLYVTSYNNQLHIRDTSGVWTTKTLIGNQEDRGMAFDNLGNIWIASTLGTSGGTTVKSYNIASGSQGLSYTLTSGTTPVGIGKDSKGNMWVVCRSDAMTEGWLEGFNPATLAKVGAIQVGFRPYAYGNFVLQPELYKICGFKLNDDTGAPIEGWTIHIDKSTGVDEWDEDFFAPIQTDPDGEYCFTDLPAGTYRVREGSEDGWQQVFPLENQGAHIVNLPDENSIYGIGRVANRPIYEIDPLTGTSTKVFDTSINSFNISGPNGLAYDSARDILYYVTYPADASIDSTYQVRAKMYKLENGVQTYVGDLEQEIACADFYNGKYYYIEGGNKFLGSDNMYEVTFNAAGNAIDHVTSLGSISNNVYKWMFYGDVAINSDGTMYGSGLNFNNTTINGSYGFFKVNLDGTGFEMINPDVGKPLQLAFGGDGVLYGHHLDSHAYFAVDTTDGTIGNPVSYSDITEGFNDMASGIKYYNFRNKLETYEISGYKFKAGTIEGLGDWTITLKKYVDDEWVSVLDENDEPLTAVTEADGKYCFSGLRAGTYRIAEVIEDSAHWRQIKPTDYYEFVLPLPADSTLNLSALNFENEELYDISGYKLDADTDEGIEGWEINLYISDRAGGWLSEPIKTTTDENGKYCFDGLTAGDYKVTETLRDADEWLQISPENNQHLITLPTGASNCDSVLGVDDPKSYNFVNAKLYDICGVKYGVNLKDGLDDKSKPLDGWTITLTDDEGQSVRDADGIIVAPITTADGGKYCFTRLRAGNYIITESFGDIINGFWKFDSKYWKPYNTDGSISVTLPEDDEEEISYDFFNQCFTDETAWAFGDIDHIDDIGLTSNNWGWSIEVTTSGAIGAVFDARIYAGAGQNEISKGYYVGTVHIVYDSVGKKLEPLVFNLNDGFDIYVEHVWIGNEPLPKDKNTNYTNAPGQLGKNISPSFEGGKSIFMAIHLGVYVPCGYPNVGQ